jgi:hypothetical protein
MTNLGNLLNTIPESMAKEATLLTYVASRAQQTTLHVWH